MTTQVPALQTDVAGMLIAAFLKRRSVTHEAGCNSVHAFGSSRTSTQTEHTEGSDHMAWITE